MFCKDLGIITRRRLLGVVLVMLSLDVSRWKEMPKLLQIMPT